MEDDFMVKLDSLIKRFIDLGYTTNEIELALEDYFNNEGVGENVEL